MVGQGTHFSGDIGSCLSTPIYPSPVYLSSQFKEPLSHSFPRSSNFLSKGWRAVCPGDQPGVSGGSSDPAGQAFLRLEASLHENPGHIGFNI